MTNITTALRLTIFLLATAGAVSGCQKKSGSGGDEAADLTGGSAPIVVSGSQPATGTTTVISNGQVKVVAVDNSGKILAEPPGKFKILGPSSTTSAIPKIAWAVANKATTYDIVISSTNDCKNPVASATGIKVLEWTVTPPLTHGNFFICATARNQFGAAVASNNGFPLTVDLLSSIPDPVLTLDDPGQYINSFTQSAFSVSGTCNASPIQVYADDGYTNVSVSVPCSGGSFNATFDASTLVDIKLTLAAVNGTVTTSRAIEKDTSSPTVVAPENDVDAKKTKSWTWGCLETNCTWRHAIDLSPTSDPTGNFDNINEASHSSGNGTVWLHIQAKDAAGNISQTSHVSAVMDTTAPVVAITSAADANALGAVGYGFSGTCDEVGVSVAWSIDDSGNPGTTALSGQAACDGAVWSVSGLDITSLDDGVLVIEATLTDPAGNTSLIASATPELDATAPQLAITSMPTVNQLNDNSYTVSGSCDEAGGEVTLSIKDPANHTVNGTAVCNGTSWTSSGNDVSGLDEGPITLTAKLTDAAGNPATEVTRNSNKNTTAPSLNLNSPASVNNTNKANFSISGFCDENGLSVAWSIDDQGNGATAAITGNATCNGTTWSASGINLTALSDGTLDVTANMNDNIGPEIRGPAPQESTTTLKDVVPPTVTVGSTTYVNNSNKTSYSFSGNCDAAGQNVGFSVDDAGNGATAAVTGSASCNGTVWNATNVNVSSLSDGTLSISASLTDAAGNAATPASGSATKDTVLPTVTINASSTVTGANESSYTLSGTCSENARTVAISVDDQGNSGTSAVTANITCSTSSWSTTLNLSALDDGTLDITANHSDLAGNAATQATGTVSHDATAPAVPNTFILNSPASNLSNNANPQLRFTGLAGYEIIRIWSDAGCSSQAATGTATSANLNINVPLSVDGVYSFYATAEDIHGNRSACSATSVGYTLDRVISALTSIVLLDPASQPSNDPTPTVTVSGTSSGDTVKLYYGSSCFVSEQLGFAVASGASVNVTVEAGKLSSDGTYQIYARSSDAAGNNSACTAFSQTYQLDTQAPGKPTGVVRASPASTPGTNTNPTFTVSGVSSGFTVSIYTSAACTTPLNSATAAGTSVTVGTGALSVDGTYTIYATQTDLAGNKSPCSTVYGTYTLDISPPSLSNVAIQSGGGKQLAGRNGYAIITFDASEPLFTTNVQIFGRAATVTNPYGLTYRATLQLVGSDASGTVPFSIDYSDILANGGPTITQADVTPALTYDNTNYAPVPTVANQNASETVLLSFDINDGGDDLDGNSQAITYSACYYDSTVNGVVAPSQACSSLSGLTMGSSTGIINWTPGYTHAGVYEFRVIATDGTVDGEVVFTVTVANTNRNPVLATVSDQTLALADIFSFDMNDTSSGLDFDVDGEPVTYTCLYDTNIDGDVSTSNSCTELDGINFNGSTGFFTWTVQPTTPGDFEFKVTGSDGNGGSGSSVFNAKVSIDISRIPQLCMVGNNVTTSFSSLSADNEVVIEDTNGSPVYSAIKQVGETFTFNTYPGYKLKCSGGCFAITPTQGTAAWSTQSYSGTLLSTYWGRNTNARVVIAAFDQAADFSINANFGSGDVVLATGSVASESITSVDLVNSPFKQTALWIESNAPISAYVSTSSGTTYDQDGRVITAAAKEALAFVSGGGGTPAAVTTTQDGTSVEVYQNSKAAPTTDADLNINELLIVTDSSLRQNPYQSAVAIYADKPVVSTQHADGDGVNSTPSLPKSMLATHFVVPMDGDYVSFASYEDGEVIRIDASGTVIQRHPFMAPVMVPNLPSVRGGPYAFSYPNDPINSSTIIPAGTRFVCSKPCMGIFEPLINDDETLMTGTKMEHMSVSSSDFLSGGVIPADFAGNRTSECSGQNDFPNLTWANLPWGTKYLAVIVQDETASNHVHLNLTDLPATTASLGKIEGANAPLSLPGGTNGANGYGTIGWSGPCDAASTHNYRFKVYALSATIGQVNGMNTATFESTYSAQILGSASITGTFGP